MRLPIALTATLLATAAFAGTKFQTSLVPTAPDCYSGSSVCLNNGESCSDPFGNSDCKGSGISTSSNVSLDGKLKFKVSVSGVKNESGALVNTGAAGAVDNYIVDMAIAFCQVDAGENPYCGTDPGQHVFIKVPLTKGKGTVKLDLTPVLTVSPFNLGAGSTPIVRSVAFLTPHASCTGTNDPSDITSRANGPATNCDDGVGVLAVPGIVYVP